MRTRLLAAFNGLPSLYQTTPGTGLPLVRQRRMSLCCFLTVTESSSPYATGDRAVYQDKIKLEFRLNRIFWHLDQNFESIASYANFELQIKMLKKFGESYVHTRAVVSTIKCNKKIQTNQMETKKFHEFLFQRKIFSIPTIGTTLSPPLPNKKKKKVVRGDRFENDDDTTILGGMGIKIKRRVKKIFQIVRWVISRKWNWHHLINRQKKRGKGNQNVQEEEEEENGGGLVCLTDYLRHETSPSNFFPRSFTKWNLFFLFLYTHTHMWNYTS